MGEAFIATILIAILFLAWLRSLANKTNMNELEHNNSRTKKNRKVIEADKEKLKQSEKQAQETAREKKRQEDVELISIILPTIRNDK
jgi:type VI protein secretion system component VasK